MSQPDLFDLEIAYSDVSCPGAQDGAIEILFSGGTGETSFNWSLNGTTYASEIEIFANLDGGEYYLNVIDENECTYDAIVEIDEPLPFEINWTISPPECSNSRGPLTSVLLVVIQVIISFHIKIKSMTLL